MVSTFESTAAAHPLRVMLVDARPERRVMVRHMIEGTGLAGDVIDEASSQEEAVDLLVQGDRDVAIVEIQMPVRQGLETIAALRSRSSEVRIVVCSFHTDAATKEEALGLGADAYLDKPVSSALLRDVLRGFFPDVGVEPPSEG